MSYNWNRKERNKAGVKNTPYYDIKPNNILECISPKKISMFKLNQEIQIYYLKTTSCKTPQVKRTRKGK